jgi:hypothetical protein
MSAGLKFSFGDYWFLCLTLWHKKEV